MCAWNPADKSSLITLTNSNRTAIKGGANTYGMIRSLVGATTKKYAEIHIDQAPSNYYAMIGLANLSASLTSYAGADGNGCSYYQTTGEKYTAGAAAAFGSSWQTGDVIGIAYNPVAGNVWFSKNGIWQASGDPEAGTNPAFNGLASGLCLALSMYTGAPNTIVTGRFVAAEMTSAPPSGFAAWDDTAAGGFDATRMMVIF